MFSLETAGTYSNIQVNTVNVSTKTAEQMIVIQEYGRTHDARDQTKRIGDSLSEHLL